ncbi:chitin synthase [Lactifluus subvellereus]|nr:chitin synthase [Lactifluus subvellereus]
MADRPPFGSLPSRDSDHISEQFQEQPRPSDVAVSLPQEFGVQNRPYDDEGIEDPLLAGGTVSGDFHPVCMASPLDPDTFGGLYGQPIFIASSGSNGVDTASQQTNRYSIIKEVKLTNGHFIMEHPVPTQIQNAVEDQWKSGVRTTEFSHMRYSAATCDPDGENGWSLRTKIYNRQTELLIAVTSYNENKTLYSCTLHGVMLNIRDICKTKRSKHWRRSAEESVPDWQKITVALIADGLEPMDKTVLDILASVGVYQDGIMKREVDGKDTVAHIFEYTTQISVVATPKVILPHGDDPNNLVPAQIIFVLKAKNQKKINSHRWLFNAIGQMLQPEICVLIDAGTKPEPTSIYYLWEAFYNDKDLGGCCGEICAMTNKGRKLLNPLAAARNFEYKMSNILDKPLESSFGYVSVLPGAFSAYRYRAIYGRPLRQYFHGDHALADRPGVEGTYEMNIFTKNMFLAEDRILSFELVAKAGAKWILAYVKPSKAETDVPETAPELIGQRRRWLNGSFAASIYAVVHFGQLYRSNHGIIRMFFFHIQVLVLQHIFSWAALVNIWLTFSIIIDLLPSQGLVFFGSNNHTGLESTHWINLILKWIYLGFLAIQVDKSLRPNTDSFILALGNRPKGERTIYAITLWVYAILAVYLLVCSLVLTVKAVVNIPNELKNKTASQVIVTFFSPPVGPLIITMVSTFGIYLFASILYRDPWHMSSSFFQYLCLVPSFTNVLNVYAFCNLHDVSWGTKGSDKAEALPSVSSSKWNDEEAAVVQDTERVQEDLDPVFTETVTRAETKLDVKEVPEKPSMDDQNKTFRTRLVVFWMLTNAALAIAIEHFNGLPSSNATVDEKVLRKTQNFYFAFILYSTFALSAVRFLGCLWYFRQNRRSENAEL